MKKTVILLLVSTLAATCTYAQVAADSAYLFYQSNIVVNAAQQNAPALLGIGPNKLSTVGLKYGIQNGHFRRVETAESARNVSFLSNGITTLGRFKTAGYFNFQRTWQDSLAWSLQGLPNTATPYYFAAAKAGEYERLNYSFGGILTYDIIPDKVYIAARATYLYNTASRSVDPRPSVQTFRFNMYPELVYKTGVHYLSTFLNLGYGKEDNSVSYKSLDYSQQSQTYADRINYLVMGYGKTTPLGASTMKRNLKDKGFGFNYTYRKIQNYLSTHIAYTEQTEDNTRSLDNSARANRFGFFKLKTYDAGLLASVNTTHYVHQLYANAQTQSGFDQNYFELNGLTNYRYSHQFVSIDYTVLNKSNSPSQMQYGFHAIYDREFKRDIGSSINSTFAYLQPAFSAALYYRFANQARFSVALMPAVRIPLGNDINVPVTNNVYANQVINPNYTYWASSAGVLKFNTNYITRKLLNDVGVGAGFTVIYQRRLGEGKDWQTSTFIPSNNRLDCSLSLNLYF